jgi:hypothetical protein
LLKGVDTAIVGQKREAEPVAKRVIIRGRHAKDEQQIGAYSVAGGSPETSSSAA